MSLGWRGLILTALLIAGSGWWWLHDDPEAQVREVHESLRRLIVKDEPESPAAMLGELRALQGLFAQETIVAGDVGSLAGSYTPQELAGTVVRMRESFDRVELGFDALEVSFPAPDEAVAAFTATLAARRGDDASVADEVVEIRQVTTRLIETDSGWRLTRLELPVGPGVD